MPVKAIGRHSFVAFYPTNWTEGTAGLPRVHRSVYFEVCVKIWDHAQPVSAADVRVMMLDIGNADQVLDDLIAIGKLERLEDGSISNERALTEAKRALDLWNRKSVGGKKGGKKGSKKPNVSKGVKSTPLSTPSTEQENSRTGESSFPSADAEEKDTEAAGAGNRVLSAWNEMAEACGLTTASTLTSKRAASLTARLKEHPEKVILRAIKAIPKSSFLMGKGPGRDGKKPWRANFDDMLRPSNMAKLVDGGYHTAAELKAAKAPPAPPPPPQDNSWKGGGAHAETLEERQAREKREAEEYDRKLAEMTGDD
jgi:hypothetical protein